MGADPHTLLTGQSVVAVGFCLGVLFLAWQRLSGAVRRTVLLAAPPASIVLAAMAEGSPLFYLWWMARSMPTGASLVMGAAFTGTAVLLGLLNLRERDVWHRRVGLIGVALPVGAVAGWAVRFGLVGDGEYASYFLGQLVAGIAASLVWWLGRRRGRPARECEACGYSLSRRSSLRARPECGTCCSAR